MFILFFNFNFKDKEGVLRNREWAEGVRRNAIVYLTRLFETKAQFSCTAKDEYKDCLLLRGYAHLNSPCTKMYMKRMLGKYSSCSPSYFGDMLSLCRFVHIDRDLTVTGRLPHTGGNSVKKLKLFAGDPKYVVKVLLDSIDKKDFERQQEHNPLTT